MRFPWVILFCAAMALAQPYDVVLKGGHVIDPANAIDGVLDVAVSGNRIAAVRANIPASEARKVVDVSGMYVVPGLIDLHAHVFGYEGALLPDDSALPAGTTTIVDAGGSGWRTFEDFQRTVISKSRTRVLALINIVGAGMVGSQAESNVNDMDPAKTSEMILRHPDVIVGVKTAHFGGTGWTAIDRAREAGQLGKVPIMVDDKIFTDTGRTTREKVLDHLRPGDMHTHMYNDRQMELINRVSGKVQPYMLEARRRGVKFDMGHGAGSFLWPVASRAVAQGFLPDSISTDLHGTSILGGQPDMPNCMSKLMLLGVKLGDTVLRATVNPAKQIGRYPEIGTLGTGKVADIAVLELRKGVFAFKDAWGVKRLGTQRLENVLTVRDGALLYDRDGRQFGAAVPVRAGESQPVYDLLIKNGQVIDPANRRNGRMDIAVTGNKIARVGQDLPAAHARVVVEAGSYYVTPGLIDIYTHFDPHGAAGTVQPDHNALPNGVTTAVTVTKTPDRLRAKTRLLAWVDPADAPALMAKYSGVVVGIKADAGNSGAAVKAAGNGIVLAEGSQSLRRGDIVMGALSRTGTSGVLFDTGTNLRFGSAKKALGEGFLPDIISTGIDAGNALLPRVNMMTTMSELLNLGMSVDQLIERATVNPARAIRHPELGTLSDGAPADIALIEMEKGKFGYVDADRATMVADRRLRCVLTVRNGAIVWDSEGLSAPDASKAGPYSNFK